MQPFDDDRYEHHTHHLPHMHHLHHTGGAVFHFDHQLSHLMQHGDLGDISEKQLRSGNNCYLTHSLASIYLKPMDK